MMKRIVGLLLTFIPIVAIIFFQGVENTRSPASSNLKHVVFDLDGTLVESLGHNTNGDVVLESGEAYRILPHAREIVRRVLDEGLEVHFFSGGPRARNLELLSKMKLASGESFRSIASTIHSFEDLTDLGEKADQQYFTDRYRKDLSKVGIIDELLIVEDNVYFPLNKAQRARALDLPIHSGGALKSWRSDQRLAWAYQALEEVFSGQSIESINNKDIHARMVKGMQKLNVNVKKELSRHQCAGIFYGLSF